MSLSLEEQRSLFQIITSARRTLAVEALVLKDAREEVLRQAESVLDVSNPKQGRIFAHYDSEHAPELIAIVDRIRQIGPGAAGPRLMKTLGAEIYDLGYSRAYVRDAVARLEELGRLAISLDVSVRKMIDAQAGADRLSLTFDWIGRDVSGSKKIDRRVFAILSDDLVQQITELEGRAGRSVAALAASWSSVRRDARALEQAIASLVFAYEGYASAQARGYRQPGIEFDDLKQAAISGMVDAAFRIDEKAIFEESRFTGFAATYVRAAIVEHVRLFSSKLSYRTGSVARDARTKLVRLARSEDILSADPADLAPRVGAPIDVVQAILSDSSFWSSSSQSDEEGETFDALASVVDDAPSSEDIVAQQEMGRAVQAALAELSPEDRVIATAIFVEEEAQQPLADRLGIPRTRLRSRLASIRSALAVRLEGASSLLVA